MRLGFPRFWIDGENASHASAHVAITAADHNAMYAVHVAALAQGGPDYGAPGNREPYHPRYYAAYVRDPDGDNIDAFFQQT